MKDINIEEKGRINKFKNNKVIFLITFVVIITLLFIISGMLIYTNSIKVESVEKKYGFTDILDERYAIDKEGNVYTYKIVDGKFNTKALECNVILQNTDGIKQSVTDMENDYFLTNKGVLYSCNSYNSINLLC